MKKLTALLLALAMVLALAACGSSSSSSSSSGSNDSTASTGSSSSDSSSGDSDNTTSGSAPESLSVGTTATLGQFLPWSSANECGIGFTLVYDQIFYLDTNDEVASDIITDYYYSDDGFTLFLTMRDDIVFSNGDAATSEDLLFSITSNVDEDRQAVTTNFDLFDMDSCYIVDDYTVAIVTYDTATAVSQFTNLVRLALLDKSWVEEVGWDADEWYTGPVGSGPYVVSDYLSDMYYTFTLRDDYWLDEERDLPQTITVTAYSEESTMYMDLENGDIAIAIEPASTDLERAMADDSDNIDYRFINGNVCNWMVLDYEGLFSDINLRKAFAHAINWEDVAYAGKGVKYESATSTIPSYFPDYINVGQYEYDPDYALECFEQYLADNNLTADDVTITMYTGPQDGSIASATVMQEYLRQIGINFEFESYEMATVVPMWQAGDGDLASYAYQGGSPTQDAYYIFKDLSSTATMGDNRTISDSTIDDLLAKALLATSEEESSEYYAEIQQWVYDNYRVISYMEEVNAVCFDTSIVTDIHLSSKDYPDLRFITYAD